MFCRTVADTFSRPPSSFRRLLSFSRHQLAPPVVGATLQEDQARQTQWLLFNNWQSFSFLNMSLKLLVKYVEAPYDEIVLSEQMS